MTLITVPVLESIVRQTPMLPLFLLTLSLILNFGDGINNSCEFLEYPRQAKRGRLNPLTVMQIVLQLVRSSLEDYCGCSGQS